ncbi:MAG: hypothetical protein E7644_01445 [Ruminococcaceae bacterium]|nr:hypothetical protein [Oscillospiraceae bacterium]
MGIRINKINTIGLKRLCEILVCLFYTWYFLPVCKVLLWDGPFKILFFGCFVVGCVGLLCFNGIRLHTVVGIVLLYYLVFLTFWLLKVGDASAHIRISFTFWGTALLYFGLLDDAGRIRIGKYLLLIFCLTAITSALGVLADNAAARTIAHAAADEELQASYQIKNIAGIYLFQSLVCFVPVLIFLPETKKQRWLSIFLMLVVLVVLINASFTISLLVFAVAIVLSVANKISKANRLILTGAVIVSLVVFWTGIGDLLLWVSNQLDNATIASRLSDLAAIFSSGVLEGDAGVRGDLYKASFNTFLRHPFGVGVHYSYRVFENGIGYHSQFLDDLARYGILALSFYGIFFVGYFKHLKCAWGKIGQSQIAPVIIMIYGLFLVLNLGFRSAEESIVMLFIMPMLPLLIEEQQKKKQQTVSTERRSA